MILQYIISQKTATLVLQATGAVPQGRLGLPVDLHDGGEVLLHVVKIGDLSDESHEIVNVGGEGLGDALRGGRATVVS